MSGKWKQAPENTLQSLRHGISHTDGIELDIRLSNDNELIVHHDSTISIPNDRLDGRSKWVDSCYLCDYGDSNDDISAISRAKSEQGS